MTFIGGSCTAGIALSKCHSELFQRSAIGRSRALLVLIAGASPGDLSVPAMSLRMCGVKIIAVGIGGLVQESQLIQMAYPNSYVLRTSSTRGLIDISLSVANLIAQGCYFLHGLFIYDIPQTNTGEIL